MDRIMVSHAAAFGRDELVNVDAFHVCALCGDNFLPRQCIGRWQCSLHTSEPDAVTGIYPCCQLNSRLFGPQEAARNPYIDTYPRALLRGCTRIDHTARTRAYILANRAAWQSQVTRLLFVDGRVHVGNDAPGYRMITTDANFMIYINEVLVSCMPPGMHNINPGAEEHQREVYLADWWRTALSLRAVAFWRALDAANAHELLGIDAYTTMTAGGIHVITGPYRILMQDYKTFAAAGGGGRLRTVVHSPPDAFLTSPAPTFTMLANAIEYMQQNDPEWLAPRLANEAKITVARLMHAGGGGRLPFISFYAVRRIAPAPDVVAINAAIELSRICRVLYDGSAGDTGIATRWGPGERSGARGTALRSTRFD